MTIISSKSNSIIKYAMSLKNKKYSKKYGECLVETEKLVLQLLDKGIVSKVFVEEGKESALLSKISKYKVDSFIITEEISKYLSDAVTTSGVFAIVGILEDKKESILSKKALILDGMQDPSNLGAVIRSARAFGFSDMYLIDAVYPYTYKVIRASMGYVFDMNLYFTDYASIQKLKDNHGFKIYIADMDGKDISKAKVTDEHIAVVIGNEGNGVSQTMIAMADEVISIPMQNGVESLNASVSASIIMYKLNELKEN